MCCIAVSVAIFYWLRLIQLEGSSRRTVGFTGACNSFYQCNRYRTL